MLRLLDTPPPTPLLTDPDAGNTDSFRGTQEYIVDTFA